MRLGLAVRVANGELADDAARPDGHADGDQVALDPPARERGELDAVRVCRCARTGAGVGSQDQGDHGNGDYGKAAHVVRVGGRSVSLVPRTGYQASDSRAE